MEEKLKQMLDMENKIEWLKYLINLDYFKQFYSRIDKIRIHKNKPYKSYFGVNLKDSNLTEIKFYFTFLYEISLEEINYILGIETSELLLESYQLRLNIFEPKIGGAGYTFSIKFNEQNTHFKTGIYFLTNGSLNDFLNLKEIKEYGKIDNPIPYFNNRKMMYFSFNTHKKMIENRELYYISNDPIKNFLATYYNEPFIEKAHEIELCTNKFEYRKINMLINLPEFELNYKLTKKGSEIQEFISKNPWLNEYTAVCPGFYPISNINSIYFINSKTIDNTSIETIENIFKKIHTY